MKQKFVKKVDLLLNVLIMNKQQEIFRDEGYIFGSGYGDIFTDVYLSSNLSFKTQNQVVGKSVPLWSFHSPFPCELYAFLGFNKALKKKKTKKKLLTIEEKMTKQDSKLRTFVYKNHL